ncbi:MAG: hypothetical protein ACFFBT_07895 [Promethearchaeota archaeon]
MTILASISANPKAVAFPIPEFAPVIIQILPSILIVYSTFLSIVILSKFSMIFLYY